MQLSIEKDNCLLSSNGTLSLFFCVLYPRILNILNTILCFISRKGPFSTLLFVSLRSILLLKFLSFHFGDLKNESHFLKKRHL